jgi:hypothetical protein
MGRAGGGHGGIGRGTAGWGTVARRDAPSRQNFNSIKAWYFALNTQWRKVQYVAISAYSIIHQLIFDCGTFFYSLNGTTVGIVLRAFSLEGHTVATHPGATIGAD